MKRLLAIVFMVVFAAPAFAMDSNDINSAGFQDLSAEQQAQVIQQIAKMKDSTGSAANLSKAKEVEAWVNIGANIGKGLAGAAKQLGIAANDFVKTPVGKMTMFIIVMHFLGGMIIHVVGGVMIWIIGLTTIFLVMRRYNPVCIEYYDADKKKVKSKTRRSMDGEATGFFLFGAAIVIVVGLLVLITF